MRTTVKEDARSNGENRLDIESILTAKSLSPNDAGNITCIGTNEAGVNSSTTYLRVIDQPYIRMSPSCPHGSPQQGPLVQVNEGEDMELSVVIEAYPASLSTLGHPNVPQRLHAGPEVHQIQQQVPCCYLLKRINAQEQGQYTLPRQEPMTHASITFQVQMYQRPVAVVRWENIPTPHCTSFGYPAPRILWYQVFLGLDPGEISPWRCNENTTGMQLPVSLLAPTVEVQREYGAVEVESVLTVGPSTRRMTVECVAFNLVGVSSDTLAMEVSDKLFTTTLAGSAGILAVLLALLVFLLYKYKQVIDICTPVQAAVQREVGVSQDKLKLGKILGAGAFGKVVEATAYGLGEEDNVMRVLSAHADEREVSELSELKILSHWPAQNIVTFWDLYSWRTGAGDHRVL
ncbi:unnamed protein product [Gadus morhua 'NCC']